MLGWVFKKVLTIPDEANPTVVEEYYAWDGIFLRVVKQRLPIKWFHWLNWKVPITIELLKYPPVFPTIMSLSLNEGFSDVPLEEVRAQIRKLSMVFKANEINTINDSEVTDGEKKIIINSLEEQHQFVKDTWSELSQEDKVFLKSFEDGGIEYLAKMVMGSTTTFFLIKRLDIVNVIYTVEVVQARKQEHIMSIKQFKMSEAFVMECLRKEIV